MTNIISVTAITEIFPECQKVTAAIVEYDGEIDAAALHPEVFLVEDFFETAVYPMPAHSFLGGVVTSPRTIEKTYTSVSPEKGNASAKGRYVVLELSPSDEAAPAMYLLGAHRNCRAHMKKVTLQVRQRVPISTANGEKVEPQKRPVMSSKTINLILDDFIQAEFQGLKYNLFNPKNYDPKRSYPLVEFIVDSWGVGPDCEITLAQGYGGTVWAFPEEQAKRECFVLSPQFPGPTIAEDDFSVREELETAKSLLDDVVSRYSIDKNRIYHTGQSMGFLSGCELNIRYPELFAGNLLVSGFWNPDTMTAMKGKNVWFFLSEKDGHAMECIPQAIDNLEKAGAKIGRYIWDGKADLATLNKEAKIVAADGNNIKYVLFQGDSVAREYCPNCHRATWLLAYQIEAVREWLFSTRKDG
jgi:predicted peptidase